jgi:hypothetical protein
VYVKLHLLKFKIGAVLTMICVIQKGQFGWTFTVVELTNGYRWLATQEAIFCIRMIIEKYIEVNKPIYACFKD